MWPGKADMSPSRPADVSNGGPMVKDEAGVRAATPRNS